MTRPMTFTKMDQLAARAPQTITMKNIREKILKGFRTLSARWGKTRLRVSPRIRGIPKIRKMVVKTSMGLRLTLLRISAVSGFNPPHRARLNGVIRMAAAVDTAVMLMDTATLPLARYVMMLLKIASGTCRHQDHPKGYGGLGPQDQGKEKGEGG